jgi:hypothetical protein
MIVETMRKQMGIPWDNADKPDKARAMGLMAEDMRSKRLLLCPGTDDLQQELRALSWDEERDSSGARKEASGQDNHLCDALLYAWRRSQHALATDAGLLGEEQWAPHLRIRDPRLRQAVAEAHARDKADSDGWSWRG